MKMVTLTNKKTVDNNIPGLYEKGANGTNVIMIGVIIGIIIIILIIAIIICMVVRQRQQKEQPQVVINGIAKVVANEATIQLKLCL